MSPRWFGVLSKLGLVVLLAHAGFAGGADLKVLSAPGMRPAIEELAPQFERASGHKLVMDYEPSGRVRKRIESGEAFDVLISTPELMQEGVRTGKLTEPRIAISRSGMGIAARAGAPKLSIDSADNLKRVLLGAKSIAYSAEGFTGAHFLGVVRRLGIDDQVRPKLKPQANGDLALRAVAEGEAELAVAGMTVLMAAPGIQIVGPLPAEVQGYVVYVAALSAATKNADGARAFIRFLTDERSGAVMKAKGFEPPAPR